MDISLFLKGVVIGLSMAIPVGPIGILCIRRTLVEGRISGLVSGVGVAIADMVYGSIAGFGLTFISDFLITQQKWLRLVGGVFLCTLGLKVYWAKLVEWDMPIGAKGLVSHFISTFLLTLTYPITILVFLGIFAGLGIGHMKDNGISIAALVLGVFAGSMLWWVILSSIIGSMRDRFNLHALKWVNRISGILLMIFGLALLLSFIL
jgi:threonine/homoserine/homoserine lactone efflux protein